MEEYLNSLGIRRGDEKAAKLAGEQDLVTKEDLIGAITAFAKLSSAASQLQAQLTGIGFTSVDAAKLAVEHSGLLQPQGREDAAANQRGSQGGTNVKPSKRMDPKVSVIKETETTEEMDRKEEEFGIYVDRTGVSEKDAAQDLYGCCETPLKQKLRNSAKFTSASTTSVKVLMEEIRRLTTPRLNTSIERQEFRLMKQDSTEKALDFESRLRQKARNCNF